MRYLLDTNIISNVTKPAPSQPLIDWLADQIDTDLFISTLSLAEIYRGILEKPTGKKRRDLPEWFGGTEGPQELFRGRILAFDERAALVWGPPDSRGHPCRTAKKRPRYADRCDRSGQRLPSRHGQREALRGNQAPQSAPTPDVNPSPPEPHCYSNDTTKARFDPPMFRIADKPDITQ